MFIYFIFKLIFFNFLFLFHFFLFKFFFSFSFFSLSISFFIFFRFYFFINFFFFNKTHFRVSIKLKNLYSSSVQVPRPRLLARDLSFSNSASSNVLQMVYVDESIDYCDRNQREGSQGTKGR